MCFLTTAEKLQSVPVGSYKEIEKKMDEGTTNRTVASTNMNATSSRAHTIVGKTSFMFKMFFNFTEWFKTPFIIPVGN